MEQFIRNQVLLNIKQIANDGFVPVAVSNRHVHLDQKTADSLFGVGYKFKKQKDLSQPGQYACEEFVDIKGTKGTLKLRVLGPIRNKTQVELSVTDARSAGIATSLRLSGDLDGTPGAKLIGPKGSVELKQGVIVAARHLHMSNSQAFIYGVKDNDSVRLQQEGFRRIVLENVIVRTGDGHELELHIDFDEANCAMISNGDLLRIVPESNCGVTKVTSNTASKVTSNAAFSSTLNAGSIPVKNKAKSQTGSRTLVTEEQIIKMPENTEILCAKNTIITPLARDLINQKKIRIRIAE